MKGTGTMMAAVAAWAMTAWAANPAPTGTATTAPAAAAPAAAAPAAGGLAAKKAGEKFTLGGAEGVVQAMDVLPLVRNEFSDRFQFDCFDNEALKTLRKQEKLDEVVAAGKNDFEKQVLLLDWAHKRVKKFGPPAGNAPRDALGILKGVDAGQAFNCGYYAEVLRAALAAMGYVPRDIGLKGAKGDGNGSEHGVVEVWCSTHRKWIVLDPTLDLYFLKGGTPLNAFELRQEWFYNKGKDLTIIVGKEAEKHTVADMPIKRGTHAGFGTLALNENSLGKFLFVAYIPQAAAGGPDYGKMFITKDKLAEGVDYHTRVCPKDPANEPYWPMQQAALALEEGQGSALKVKADTMTPDFDKFRHRVDGGAWTDGPPPAEWKLHRGANTLEVAAVNKFGVEGAISKASLEMK